MKPVIKLRFQSLSKQSSLIESRFDSSDEDHTPVEEQGNCKIYKRIDLI